MLFGWLGGRVVSHYETNIQQTQCSSHLMDSSFPSTTNKPSPCVCYAEAVCLHGTLTAFGSSQAAVSQCRLDSSKSHTHPQARS